MSTRTAGRTLTVAALAATLIGAGSPAGAAPAAGPPYTASTATTRLFDVSTGFTAEVTVTAVDGTAPRLDVALYREGWACTLTGDPAVLRMVTLESALAEGRYAYSCTVDSTQGVTGDPRQRRAPRTLTGAADLDLAWTGVGEQRPMALDHCVGRYLVRAAEVDGGLSLSGDARGVLRTALPDDNSRLSYDHHVCPPGIP